MRVYLFRGLAGAVFSTGMDDLATKLREAGHDATVHSWVERTGIQAEAISQFQSGELVAPIAIVGHSLGGNSANFMGNNLVAHNIPVAYIATIDPTEPRANPKGVPADNFRSRDFRAEKVDGAIDFSRPELNHIQIDKDDRVHQRILLMSSNAATQMPAGHVAVSAESDDAAGQLAALVENLIENTGEPSDARQTGSTALTALVERLRERLKERVAAEEPGGTLETSADDDMPVNNALGKKIGGLLNGKKTATGILGAVATMVLPILFPQLAPVKAVFDTVGIGVSATADPGQSLFMPIFSALTGWGVLGKLEKWVNLLKK